jgi:uncharacterized protein (TIGR03118 family)
MLNPKLILSAIVIAAAGHLCASTSNRFAQANLTSDLPGVAAHQDPNLVNPWGIVAGPSTPFWINGNGAGVSALYNGSGAPLPLVVSIPAPSGGAGAPTGIVFNSTTDFSGSPFLFSTEDGTIARWSPSLGTTASIVANTGDGSVYKGLALGSVGSTNFLYATNFGTGHFDVFDSSFHPATVQGTFNDPNLPAGYAPFGIRNINGDLYVTYALQDSAKHDDVAGAGHGFVDVFDTNGNLLHRLVTMGALNSPWGLAVAPSTFGAFGGDLLVGNFGDGTINAYNALTGTMVGTLDNTTGSPLVNKGLWGLDFGNGAFGQDSSKLYFTAGIPGPGMVEDHGLFGSVTATPEPSSILLMVVGLAGSLIAVNGRRRRALPSHN